MYFGKRELMVITELCTLKKNLFAESFSQQSGRKSTYQKGAGFPQIASRLIFVVFKIVALSASGFIKEKRLAVLQQSLWCLWVEMLTSKLV